MQTILTRGLFPEGLTKEKAVSLGASIAVNLALVVAFASIANIDGQAIKEGASLVVVGLSGAASEAESQPEAAQPASLPAPPPVTEPAPPAPTPDFVRPAEKPIEPKIALLQRPEPVAERSEAAPAQSETNTQPSPDQMREAAEQQRKAQEAARARATEQAQNEARAAAAAAAASQRAASPSSARAGGSGGYGAIVIQHLRRFTHGNSVGAGATLVRITIDGNGSLQEAAVITSSGSASFDREAMQTVRRAAPFPKPPSGETRTINFNFTGR